MTVVPLRDGQRNLPQNLDAERALLGLILLNNDAYYRVSQFLATGHFFSPRHQEIYERAAQLIGAGKTASPVTMRGFIQEPDFLDNLVASATTILNATEYGTLIQELAQKRALIALSQNMADAAYGPDDAANQIDEAERELYALAETNKYGAGFQTFKSALTSAMDMAGKAYQRDGGLSGLATGLIDLDQFVGGMQPSDLIIVAGRPGMGKTALASNIAFNVARVWQGEVQPDGRLKTVNGGRVGFFSLEMSAEQLATRIVSEQSGVPSSKIRRGKITQEQFEQIAQTSALIETTPLYIDECGGLTVAQIAARARRLKRTYGLDLLVIDYLQLITGTTRRSNENRVNEITEITQKLKALAKELAVPILALAQLSRAVESREDKRPQLPDLRESGSIEQDADVVLFVFREEYYHKIKKPRQNSDKFAAWVVLGEQIAGKAEIIIAKHRHGPVGTVELQFEATLTRFDNLARE